MGWAHAATVRIKDAAGEERGWATQPAAPRHRLGGKLALNRLKQRGLENGLMLTAVNLAPVDDLADIEAVLEQMRERAHAKAAPADGAAIREPPRLAADASMSEVVGQRSHRAKFQVALKDRANRLGLGRDDHDLLVRGHIAERDRAADPQPLALRGRDLVAHPLPDQLALELGKGQEHIEREPPHAGAGVE